MVTFSNDNAHYWNNIIYIVLSINIACEVLYKYLPYEFGNDSCIYASKNWFLRINISSLTIKLSKEKFWIPKNPSIMRCYIFSFLALIALSNAGMISIHKYILWFIDFSIWIFNIIIWFEICCRCCSNYWWRDRWSIGI